MGSEALLRLQREEQTLKETAVAEQQNYVVVLVLE